MVQWGTAVRHRYQGDDGGHPAQNSLLTDDDPRKPLGKVAVAEHVKAGQRTGQARGQPLLDAANGYPQDKDDGTNHYGGNSNALARFGMLF